MRKRVPQQPAGVSFRPASTEERVLLENLAQFYSYDFSEVLEMHVDEDGRFGDVGLAPYWVDEWRHPFVLRVDDRLAGFALISERSKITGKSGVFDMTEFFVLRRFRRHGVGRAAAFAAFDRFAGPWEVRQREENPNATTFWRRAIDEYTRGDYEETRWVRPQWSEIVQTFSTASSGPDRSGPLDRGGE
ncbi:MAG TPA: GNAT family N-acetyltransferase [Polyangiaceae bacterium]|nr:GNAT family N-acetyltransferase [Polyangiaceae bacterium]